MIRREEGLIEIFNRIKDNRLVLGLVSFQRSPTNPIDFTVMPSLFMLEGTDIIVTPSKRGPNVYPARRQLEVTLELVTSSSVNIRALLLQLRVVVLTDTVVAQNTFIQELRAEGPNGYGIPDVLGMRLVLGLMYTDEGV